MPAILALASLAYGPGVGGLTQAGAAVAGPGLPKLGPGGSGVDNAPETCSSVTIKSAALVVRNGDVVLKAAGLAPFAGMTLEVRPVVYVMHPDYWLMALVGCLPQGKVAAPVPTPFEAEVPLHGSIGSKGIDLTGEPAGPPLRLNLPG